MSRESENASRSSRVVLPLVLVATMAASTVQLFVIAVGAGDIIDDLNISKFSLGLAGALNSLAGALVSPWVGRLTDRIGSRRSVIVALVVSALGLAVTASAGSVLVLALGSALSGIPNGWCNPATNKLIADRVPEGRRGAITGVKQSGVQLAVFLTGISFPSLAAWQDWRGATWIFVAIVAALAVLAAVALEPASASERSDIAAGSRSLTESERRFVRQLAIFAVLMGTAGGAFGRWLPLYAEEALGMTAQRAGLVVAFMGVVGIVARILLGTLTEHRFGAVPTLRWLAMGALVTYVVATLAPSLGANTLWFAAAGGGLAVNGWNAVAMLAVIGAVPRSLAGRASGPVLLGFLGGLSIGAPAAGWAIDRFDDYRPVWVVAAVLALLAAASLQRADAAAPDGPHGDEPGTR